MLAGRQNGQLVDNNLVVFLDPVVPFRAGKRCKRIRIDNTGIIAEHRRQNRKINGIAPCSLQLGDHVLQNVLVTFPEERYMAILSQNARNGNLGNGTMKRFHVTFDYGNKRLFLQPNRQFKEPFEYDMSGIRLREDRDRPFWIEELLPDSPGLDAGLHVNDVLVDVNGEAAEEMGLGRIKKLFKREGEEVSLVFRRGDERITVKIKLRRLV